MDNAFEQVTQKLFKLMRLMTRRNHRVGAMPFFGGMQRGQGRILAMLKMKPDMTQKELSFLLNIRNQSLGELLAKLEKKEFVERVPCSEDKRVMRVRLTKKGEQAAEKAQDGASTIFESLSEDELACFELSLDKLIKKLEEELGEDDVRVDVRIFKQCETDEDVVVIDEDMAGMDEDVVEIDEDIVEIDEDDGECRRRIKKIVIDKKVTVDRPLEKGTRHKIIVNNTEVDPSSEQGKEILRRAGVEDATKDGHIVKIVIDKKES